MENNKEEMARVEQVVNEVKVAKQLELEELMHGEGVSRYEKQLEKNGQAHSRPGMGMLQAALKPMSAVIQTWTSKKKSVSRLRRAVDIFEEFDPDDLAFITLRRLISGAGHNESSTTVCTSIGGLVHDELEYRKFKAENPQAFGWTMQYAKKYSVASMAKKMTLLAKRRAGIADDKWSLEKRANIGKKLLELAMDCVVQSDDGRRFVLFEKERRHAGTRQDIIVD